MTQSWDSSQQNQNPAGGFMSTQPQNFQGNAQNNNFSQQSQQGSNSSWESKRTWGNNQTSRQGGPFNGASQSTPYGMGNAPCQNPALAYQSSRPKQEHQSSRPKQEQMQFKSAQQLNHSAQPNYSQPFNQPIHANNSSSYQQGSMGSTPFSSQVQHQSQDQSTPAFSSFQHPSPQQSQSASFNQAQGNPAFNVSPLPPLNQPQRNSFNGRDQPIDKPQGQLQGQPSFIGSVDQNQFGAQGRLQDFNQYQSSNSRWDLSRTNPHIMQNKPAPQVSQTEQSRYDKQWEKNAQNVQSSYNSQNSHDFGSNSDLGMRAQGNEQWLQGIQSQRVLSHPQSQYSPQGRQNQDQLLGQNLGQEQELEQAQVPSPNQTTVFQVDSSVNNVEGESQSRTQEGLFAQNFILVQGQSPRIVGESESQSESRDASLTKNRDDGGDEMASEDLESGQANAKACSDYVFDTKYENDEFQRTVISLDSGYHLVLAPPGCGKTDILAERVVRALSKGIQPKRMLCLTFTNRAARGMRDRIVQRLGLGQDSGELDIFVGNVHRFCAHYLFNNRIVPANTTIIDEQDTTSILKSLVGAEDNSDWDEDIPVSKQNHLEVSAEALQKAFKIQHTIYQLSHGCSLSMLLHLECFEEMRNFFSSNYLEFNRNTLEQLYQEQFPYFKYWDVMNGTFQDNNFVHLIQLARLYAEYKQSHNLVDFDDLLVMTYAHAKQDPDSLDKFTWIQIDELQDLSPFQFGIVDLFTDHTQNNVTLYLGDEQQAIFSFLGAKLSTLDWLKQRCGENVHHLFCNYRSPKYLLDVFNIYAHLQLNVSEWLLPQSKNFTPIGPQDLTVTSAQDKNTEARLTAFLVSKLHEQYPQERIAILVSSNKDADLIAESLILYHLPHFKISGTDLFTLKKTKLMLAHLSVLHTEFSSMAWARLLFGLKLFDKSSAARDFVAILKDYAMLPTDLLRYELSSYMLEMQRHCSGTFVIFDTETTGLDVFSDDIVQIAALKIQDKTIVDKFNLILKTTKEIPDMLGDIENPLVAEYQKAEQNHECYERQEGLQRFLDFVGDCPLIGHNVEYDYHILDNNLQRDCGYTTFAHDHPVYFDTLKAIRLIKPQLKRYKLKSLLEELGLQGENTHLADDDIVATKSLLDFILYEFSFKQHGQITFLQEQAKLAQKFRDCYAATYFSALSRLYVRPQATSSEADAGAKEAFRVESQAMSGSKVAVVQSAQPETILGMGKESTSSTRLDPSLASNHNLNSTSVFSPSLAQSSNLEHTTTMGYKADGQQGEQLGLRGVQLGQMGAVGQDSSVQVSSLQKRGASSLEVVKISKFNGARMGSSFSGFGSGGPSPVLSRLGLVNLGIVDKDEVALVSELENFYEYCVSNKLFTAEPKMSYIFNFLSHDVITKEQTPSLYEQLNAHMVDIVTYREADLCDSSCIKENIFVSTVHKAKGLEFENVIIFDAVDGVYPQFYKQEESQIAESARLFYVAMTRAKRRLTITYCKSKSGISKRGKPYTMEQVPTRFLRSIRQCFNYINGY